MDERGRVFTAIGVHYVFQERNGFFRKGPSSIRRCAIMRTAPRFWVAAWVLSALLPVSRPRSAAARPSDVYFDLTTTEYKDFSPQKAVLQGSSSGNFSPAATTASSALNTVTRALSAAAVATSTVSAVKVILRLPARSIQSSKLYVGAQRKANGKYYSTSTAPTPAGTLSGQQVQVRRIVSRTNPHPYCVQDLSGVVFGWMSASDLTEVNR